MFPPMRSRLTPLVKLFYNPLQGMTEISARAPYIAGAVLALLATYAYYELLSGRLQGIIAGSTREGSMGLFTPIMILAYLIIAGVLRDSSPILFLAVVFVPACL